MQAALPANAVRILRALLEAERQQAQGALARVQGELRDREQTAGGEQAPRAPLDAVLCGAVERALLREDALRLKTTLDAIQEARRRLAGGTYGLCADCGRPIPFAHLLLDPAAARDVEYAASPVVKRTTRGLTAALR